MQIAAKNYTYLQWYLTIDLKKIYPRCEMKTASRELDFHRDTFSRQKLYTRVQNFPSNKVINFVTRATPCHLLDYVDGIQHSSQINIRMGWRARRALPRGVSYVQGNPLYMRLVGFRYHPLPLWPIRRDFFPFKWAHFADFRFYTNFHYHSVSKTPVGFRLFVHHVFIHF